MRQTSRSSRYQSGWGTKTQTGLLGSIEAIVTPGPWHVNDVIRDKLYIESQKEFIADVQLEECSGIGEAMRVRANVALIAAAPELLEALKTWMDWIEQYYETVDTRKARALIATAEGRTR